MAAKKNVRKSLLVRQEEQPLVIFKGIVPHKIFYRSNLIFWIVMGCSEAHFGRKDQKFLILKNLVSKFVPWDLEAIRD